MTLVSLSSVVAFLDGDAKLMVSTVRMLMICIVSPTLKKKEPGHIPAVVHAKMRDKTNPVQVSFSDSLWARIRHSRTNVGPRNQDPEENESVDSTTKTLI